jgi:hypothetical protein
MFVVSIMVLTYNLKEQSVRVVDWIKMAGFCEHGNEPSGYIKSGICLEHVSDYQLLKSDCSS